MKVVEWSKSFKMETWITLNSVQVWDTLEFYPILALDGAFGRTRPICRNPIWLILEMFRSLIRGVRMSSKGIKTLIKS